MNSKNILVICYTFPPSAGIGGRRWAKFSKYLSNEGYTVHVVSAQNLRKEISFWNNDIQGNTNIKPTYLKFQFQKIITKPRNILEKICRKIFIQFLRLTKYSEIFITSFPNKAFWKKTEEVIARNNIKTVIVSGDPFLFYYASLLKKKMGFKLIIDYRDLWNDHSFYSTYISISRTQKKYFEFTENEAINNSDKIVVVDDYLKQVLSKRLRSKSNEVFEVIHNGFDPDDFINSSSDLVQKTNKIKLYFSGNISSDKNEVLIHFLQSFKVLQKNAPDIYNEFVIHFYGNMDASILHTIQGYGLPNLSIFNTSFPLTEYTKQVKNSEVGMLLVSKDYPHSFYTKFTDYLYLDKFILAIGYEGALSQFLHDKNIGYTYTLKDNYTFFLRLKEKIKEYKAPSKEIKEQFDLNFLTKKYIEVIES
jgi:glycosyltransferase involved in cell wall biosynthesis